MSKKKKKKNLKLQSNQASSNESNHYHYKRKRRDKIIERKLHGDGYIIDGFVIDRGHKDGLEVHSITENGVIIIHNYHTGKLITKLIARPEQIKRYYEDSGMNPPEYVLLLAKWHKDLGYNRR